LLKNQLQNSEDDKDMFFFKSLLPHFKKMNAIQKLRVRNQFQGIILNELQSSEIRQPLLTTANMPYHYNTTAAGTSYSYPSSSSSMASYCAPNDPDYVQYNNNNNNSQPSAINISQNSNSDTLEKNSLFSI
jgi:hypothetical protein